MRRDKGDLDEALKDFSEAIRLKPDLAEASNNRGDVHGHKGDLDGMRQDLIKAARLSGNDVSPKG
jgi:Flp pilus assembly protein TadD